MDRSKIKFLKHLGQDNFGIVFLGKCEDIRNEEDEPTEVAVKPSNRGVVANQLKTLSEKPSFNENSNQNSSRKYNNGEVACACVCVCVCVWEGGRERERVREGNKLLEVICAVGSWSNLLVGSHKKI